MPIIQNRFYKPRLKIGYNFRSPDCHKTLALLGQGLVEALYIRFYIQNEGRSAVKDLEVIVNKIERRNKNDWQLFFDFLPSNLVWTNLGGPTLNNLSPKLKRNVDLGFIHKPLISSRNQVETELVVCISNLIHDKFNKFSPSEYKFSIIAGSSNCGAIEAEFLLSFNKEWQNEAAMFKSMKFKMLKLNNL